MVKVIAFDMDGTIVDLYGVTDWLEKLHREDSSPYSGAKPLVDVIRLNTLIQELKENGWIVGVITWGSKESSIEYENQVAIEKIRWLRRYNMEWDFFSFQSYGTNKRSGIEREYDIAYLVDDNEEVRKEWGLHETINAQQDIFKQLEQLLYI